MADGGGTLYPYPRGQTAPHLYEHAKALVDALNRVRTADQTTVDVSISGLQELIDAINAVLSDIEENGGLTAQQEFELSLVTAVSTVLGSVSNLVLDTIQRSNAAAEATIRSLLAGQQNKVEIRTEQTARLTQAEAFAQQITTAFAQIGLAQAAITDEITARSTGDSANAMAISNVSTALNGNIAQVLTLQESVDGIEARWGVAVNLNGQVVGLVQLDGDVTGSTFTVVADKFLVAQPGVAGGNPIPVFAISNVNGVTKIAFRGDMYADGSILTRHLAAGSVTAANIAAGSIVTSHLAAGELVAPLLRNQASTSFWNLNTGDFQIG